jgi:hypothetical protein
VEGPLAPVSVLDAVMVLVVDVEVVVVVAVVEVVAPVVDVAVEVVSGAVVELAEDVVAGNVAVVESSPPPQLTSASATSAPAGSARRTCLVTSAR